MSEPSLVAFTLLLQASVGAAWALALLDAWLAARGQAAAAQALAGPGWWLVAGLAGLGLLASTAHLARPGRAWRAISHLGSSWLSREVLLAGAFTGSAAAAAGLGALGAPAATPARWCAAAAPVLGAALLLAMAQAYRLPAVRAWQAATTPLAFLAATLLLGGLAAGAVLATGPGLPPDLAGTAWSGLALAVAAAAAGQLAVFGWWLLRMPRAHRSLLLETGAGLVRARLALGGLGLLATSLLAAAPGPGLPHLAAAALLAAGEVLGRSLFYAGRVPDGVYLQRG